MDFAELDVDFCAGAVVAPPYRGRFVAVGEFKNEVIVTVVFLPMGSEALSVISMRPASRKERNLL